MLTAYRQGWRASSEIPSAQNLQQFGVQTCHVSHDSSIAHIHKAARFNLIDSPKGFGMGFIVHN